MKYCSIVFYLTLSFFCINEKIIQAQYDGNKRFLKIGSLLPEINNLSLYNNRPFDSRELNFKYDLSIYNAIRFASKKLSELFFQEYGCDLVLDIASTKVSFLVTLLNNNSIKPSPTEKTNLSCMNIKIKFHPYFKV